MSSLYQMSANIIHYSSGSRVEENHLLGFYLALCHIGYFNIFGETKPGIQSLALGHFDEHYTQLAVISNEITLIILNNNFIMSQKSDCVSLTHFEIMSSTFVVLL